MRYSERGIMIEIIPNVEEIKEYVELAEQYSLGFEYNDFFEPDLLDDEKALKERLHIYQCLERPKRVDTLHGAFYDLSHFSPDSGIRRHSLYRMQQSVEIAGQLECRAVVFHGGLNPRFMKGNGYYDNWLEWTTKVMEQLLAQDKNLDIYCENVLENSPEVLSELAERFCDREHFGICLDIAHMLLAIGEPEEWFQKLHPYIRHFHINDTCLQSDDHLTLGKGRIPWDIMFGLMKKYDLWDVSRLLEIKGLDKIRESLDFLEDRKYL